MRHQVHGVLLPLVYLGTVAYTSVEIWALVGVGIF